jgi:hypothetical protein
MITLSYNSCFLIITTKDAFRVVGMQTDNTLILEDDNFAQIEDNELKKANLKAKPTKALSYETSLIFNRYILH